MHLADHIRPLLRDHDCVIIPDFGGLVADVSSARAQPGRQALSPPTKLVAFNQALTRNDGLLVDALSQRLGLPIAQAREAVRTAVASLQQELDETNRTELPGIGIFRRAVGRGLAFEYTGTDNLLAAAFGLPVLAARPIRATDARAKRPQPVLRSPATRRSRWARLLPGGVIAIAAGLLLLVNYQVVLKAGYLPSSWQTQGPNRELAQQRAVPAPLATEPQQATLGQHDFSSNAPAAEGMTPAEAPAAISAPLAATATAAPLEAAPVAVAAVTPKVAVPARVVAARVAARVAAPVLAAPATRATPVAAAKAAAIAAKPVLVKAPVAVAGTVTIKTRTGRYYIIAAAYSSLARAEQGCKALANTGRVAHIMLPPYGSRLFRLAVADYADLASAQRAAQQLRISTRGDYNTLKF